MRYYLLFSEDLKAVMEYWMIGQVEYCQSTPSVPDLDCLFADGQPCTQKGLLSF